MCVWLFLIKIVDLKATKRTCEFPPGEENEETCIIKYHLKINTLLYYPDLYWHLMRSWKSIINWEFKPDKRKENVYVLLLW